MVYVFFNCVQFKVSSVEILNRLTHVIKKKHIKNMSTQMTILYKNSSLQFCIVIKAIKNRNLLKNGCVFLVYTYTNDINYSIWYFFVFDSTMIYLLVKVILVY